MKLTILGDPTTKKNSQQIFKNKATNKPFITQSKKYKDYRRVFLMQVSPKDKKQIDYEVNVKCVFYRKHKYRVDLSNLLSATNDLLVESGVLHDDDSKVIVSHDGSRVKFDKENPRVEIEIRRVNVEN